MNREIAVLVIAALLYLGGFVYAVYRLRNGSGRPAKLKLAVMATGFCCQTLFLHWRGQAIGGCPISNPFELLTFVSWAVVLFYFLTGSAYRLSLLGLFTSPLAFVFQTIALLRPEAALPPEARAGHGFWSELHAALSLVAYGAFGLACAAGVMFLIEDWQLKRRRRGGVFRHLPPIQYLSNAIRGLILTGTVLLSAGIASAYQMSRQPDSLKLALVWIVWGVYAALLGYERWRGMSARRAAAAAVAGFLVPVLSLWFVSGGGSR